MIHMLQIMCFMFGKPPMYLNYMNLSRSAYTGSQRYTWAQWTGDPSSDWYNKKIIINNCDFSVGAMQVVYQLKSQQA